MLTLYKQELYKQIHKIGWWVAAGIMVLGQILFGVLAKKNPGLFPAATLVSRDYVTGGLALFIVIASTASTIAMEYQYGTMKQLLYRQYYRSQIFISKILTVLTQLLFLQVLASAVTIILTLVLFPSYHWAAHVNGLTYGLIYLRRVGGGLLDALLLLSLVLLLSTVFKSNAVAIATGLVGYFLVMVASSIMLALIAWHHWLKFLPFTFLLTGGQINAPQYASVTHFSTPEMIAGTLIYTVIFTVLSYLSFRKRSV